MKQKFCGAVPPKAIVHFIGGAFVGAAPQLSYRALLEALAARGVLVSLHESKSCSMAMLETCIVSKARCSSCALTRVVRTVLVSAATAARQSNSGDGTYASLGA